MYELIYNFLEGIGLPSPIQPAAYLISLTAIVLISLVTRIVVRSVLKRITHRLLNRSKRFWGATLLKNKLFLRAADFSIPIVLSLFVETLPYYNRLLDKIAGITGVVVILLLIHSLIQSFEEIYRQHEASKTRPLKSLLQVIDIACIIVGGLVALAILTGINVSVIVGGVGAAAAVVSLIFKDAILGFVAGIQLITNDMIRIGDWIEMPSQSADGTVVDLSITTVKVENFDKTITSIPAYAMVSSAFINWRGMETSGGRRIKRAIYIDASDVRLCDDKMIAHLRGIALLRDYIDAKLGEIAEHNKEQGADLSHPVNGRRITNLGTLRAYISAYLMQHPDSRKDMTCIVRQLAPDDRGIPLEIYAFANTVQWAEYEAIQSDIFDHLYAIIPEFGLRVYQKPSSGDIRAIGKRDKTYSAEHDENRAF